MEEKAKTSFLRSIQVKAMVSIAKRNSKEIKELKEEILYHANKGSIGYVREKKLTPLTLEYLLKEGFNVRPITDEKSETYHFITWLDREELKRY